MTLKNNNLSSTPFTLVYRRRIIWCVSSFSLIDFVYHKWAWYIHIVKHIYREELEKKWFWFVINVIDHFIRLVYFTIKGKKTKICFLNELFCSSIWKLMVYIKQLVHCDGGWFLCTYPLVHTCTSTVWLTGPLALTHSPGHPAPSRFL